MRILAFVPYTINTPHYETQLDLLEDHLLNGDEVIFLGCNAELSSCDVNYFHMPSTCMRCMSKRNVGLKLLSRPVLFKSFYRLTAENVSELGTLRQDFASIEDLKQYKIENFDIGLGVASSLISFLRVSEPDVAENREIISRFLFSALTVYRSLGNHLEDLKPDLVYLYNGRYAPLRAAMRACQSRNIPFKVHEVGHSLQHYALWDNSTPHDIGNMNNRIRQKWQAAAADTKRDETAEAFYLNRSKGLEYVYLTFTKEQQQGLLPADWDPGKKNMVFFSTSDYEVASLGEEWKFRVYASQYDGITQIVKALHTIPERKMHLFVRMHPNLKDVKDPIVDSLKSMKDPYLTIIPPESRVSTYAMLRNADKVITFYSTTGIEAVYWGVPSIALGASYYYDLGGTYNPKSHSEVMDLLLQDLAPKDKTPALMYGYYLNTFGLPFKYYDSNHIFKGEFKGVNVQPALWVRTVLKERRGYRFIRKPLWRLSSYLLEKGI